MPEIRRIMPILPRKIERKRVAAYARVSVDTEMLMHSLSAQVSYYSSLIQKNPGWEYAGVYADEGITGTSTKKRDEFNRLIADCKAGQIDLVLVKSISRFARDTVDTLKTTRQLKELGIDVYFERENIHSMSEDGELMLTLLASFAQEESRSISANVTWRIRKKFEQGIPNGHKAPYGYEWDGEMFRIIPEQGMVVKEIYRRYLAGDSAYKIAMDLARDGVVGQSGVPMDDSTIKNILTSESYMGTMILQKNFFTEEHTRKRNRGELQRYAVEEMFEPLVSEEDFIKAVQIRMERADQMPNKNPKLTAFSGLVKCSNCGCSVSRRTTKYGKRWVCNTRERKGKSACDVRPIYESELVQATCTAFHDEETMKRETEQIIISYESIDFLMKNGQTKKVMRSYAKGHSAFSKKIVCGGCGSIMESDTWSMGPAGQKKKEKVWKCRACSSDRILESEISQAAEEVLETKDYDARFQQVIDKITVFDEYLEFTYKDGKVTKWQRK